MTQDLGTIFTLNGAGITTAYQASPSFNGGRPSKFRFSLLTTTILASNVTSMLAKVSASRDGVTWEDVNSFKDDLTFEVEHTFTLGAAGTAQVDTFVVDGSFLYLKVSLKVAGGVGQINESLLLSAMAV